MAGPELPLAGRRVLVTRPERRGEGLAQRLRDAGADVAVRPTIALEASTPGDEARRAVRQLRRYDWLLFTSPAGVQFFFELRRELQRAGSRISASIGAIGPGTAGELEREGHAAQVIAEDSRSEGLARAMRGRLVPGQRVLVVRPEGAGPILIRSLEQLGVRPDPVAFYRNVPAPGLDDVVRDVCDGKFDVVVFSSPSTLERLFRTGVSPREEVRTALERCRLVAIGPVTAEAIEGAGLEPAGVATEPTDVSLLQCIESLFR